jgi:hypothetical protein
LGLERTAKHDATFYFANRRGEDKINVRKRVGDLRPMLKIKPDDPDLIVPAEVSALQFRVAELEQQLIRQDALSQVIFARLNAVEARNERPAIGSEWVTLKAASYLSGYSQSGIRRRIKAKLVLSRSVGGRVLVSTTNLTPKVRKNG